VTVTANVKVFVKNIFTPKAVHIMIRQLGTTHLAEETLHAIPARLDINQAMDAHSLLSRISEKK
jgi:hypothetical protein